MEDLNMEASRFRDDLWKGIRDLSWKTDLIVLVHNLSHKIPWYSHSNASQQQPALTLLLDEAKALGIPWVLAITNKFSVSVHQQKAVIDAVLQAYQASPHTTEVINSCPYVMPSAASASLFLGAGDTDSDGRMGPQKFFCSPINLVWRPFQKKAVILPVDGVTALCQLVHRVLRSQEEAAMQELARDRLLLELVRERPATVSCNSRYSGQCNLFDCCSRWCFPWSRSWYCFSRCLGCGICPKETMITSQFWSYVVNSISS